MPVPTPLSPTPAVPCHAPAPPAKKPPTAKKIFLFLDGTGNEFIAGPDPTGGNSNVVKLYTTLRVADNQVAYYHPGVGTMGDPSIRYALPRFWSKVKGLAFGAGFQANVLDAYRYLMEVYNDGDEIYIFGFSRGAYTARTLAAMLHGYGLLCRGNEGHLLYAWNMFHTEMKTTRGFLKIARAQRGNKRAHSIKPNFAFLQTYSREVTVRFMGVWDTVSSVGWIYEPLRLLDMAQNPIIQVGRHAVSIDERRAFFRDNLWGPPVPITDEEWSADLRVQGIQQDIAQVWFPGVHSDVGGSYTQTEASPANQALHWMIHELQQHGAVLCHERVTMVLGTRSHILDADRLYTPAPHKDHALHDSLKGFWLLLQAFPQQYYSKDDSIIQWRVPYSRPRAIPANSIIHGSAHQRLISTTPGEEIYQPRNLTLNQLMPIADAPPHLIPATNADLTGCYICQLPPNVTTTLPDDSTPTRYAKLIAGWITFILFWLVIGSIAWYILALLVLAATGFYVLLTHTPGLKHLYHLLLRSHHTRHK